MHGHYVKVTDCSRNQTYRNEPKCMIAAFHAFLSQKGLWFESCPLIILTYSLIAGVATAAAMTWQLVLPKRRCLATKTDGVTFQKAALFMVSTVRALFRLLALILE